MKKNCLLVVILLTRCLLYSLSAEEKTNSEYMFKEDDGIPVVITATKKPHLLKNIPVKTNVIDKKEIEKTGMQTISDAVRTMPGINLSGGATFGASRRLTPLLAGLPAQYSLVLIDGKRTKSEHIHTGINLNTMPVETIERIEVVKGPSSAVYGSDAFGGVINVITKSIPVEPLYKTDLSYGTLDTKNITLTYGSNIIKDRLGYLIIAKRGESAGLNNVWYKQNNVLTKMNYLFNQENKLSLAAGYYGNNYPGTPDNANDNKIDLSLDYKRNIGNSSLNINVSLTDFNSNQKNTADTSSQYGIEYQNDFFGSNFITSGLEIRTESFMREATPKKSEIIYSCYLQDEISVVSLIDFVLSMRLDYYENIGTVFNPSTSLLYRATPKTNIRVSAGKGFRAPSLQDRYEYHFFHKILWRDGNPDLRPEYLINYTAGIEQKMFNDKLLAYFSIYKNDITDMIDTVPTGQIENGLPVVKRQNIKKAYNQGLETELKYKIADIITSLSYTYLDTSDNEGKVLSYSPKHSYNVKLYYLIEKIKLMLYTSTEISQDRYYKDTNGNVNKLNNYILTNLNLNKSLYNNIEMNFTIENIFDQKFETYEEGKSNLSLGRVFKIGISAKL